MSDEETFDNVTSGVGTTENKQCSSLRKNHHIVIKNRPCKVVEMSTSKTGKHGSAKVHLVAIDIFTGRKYEEISPSTANILVPRVTRNDFLLVDIEQGYLSLMDDNGEMRQDIQLPSGDIGTEIEEKQNSKKPDETVYVTVVGAMDEEHAVSLRVVRDSK